MKTYKFFFMLAVGAAIVACTPKPAEPAVDGEDTAQAVKTLKDYTPTKAEIDTVQLLFIP